MVKSIELQMAENIGGSAKDYAISVLEAEIHVQNKRLIQSKENLKNYIEQKEEVENWIKIHEQNIEKLNKALAKLKE